MGLSLDDILNSPPRFRTKEVDYGNGLKFELHTFDADAFKEVAEKLADNDGSPVSDDDCTGFVIRAIEGQDCKPTPEQIASFRSKIDKGVIQSLMLDWMALNRGAEDLAEAAKKS